MRSKITEHEMLLTLATMALKMDDLSRHDVIKTIKELGHEGLLKEARAEQSIFVAEDCECSNWAHVGHPSSAYVEGGHHPDCPKRERSEYTTQRVLSMLRNMGHDTDCGACMAVAFSGVGMPGDEHTCKGPVELLHGVRVTHECWATIKGNQDIVGNKEEMQRLVSTLRTHQVGPDELITFSVIPYTGTDPADSKAVAAYVATIPIGGS